MSKKGYIVECPYCKGQQIDEFYDDMELDDEEENECWVCDEPFLVYREDETTFNLYKLV